MLVIKKLILFFILSVLLVGCYKKEEKHSSKGHIKIIDINNGIENSIKMNLSSIAKDIENIKLENTEKSIVGNIINIVIGEKYIVITDHLDNIKVFSRNGKFIRKIGQKGRGPNEYLSTSKIQISEKYNEIFLYDGGSARILIYDILSGKCRKAKKTIYYPDNFILYKDSLLCFLYSAASFKYTKNNHHLILFDRKLKRKRFLMERKYTEKFLSSIDYGFTNMYIKDDDVMFWESDLDTVYLFNVRKKVIYPYMLFKYDKFKKVLSKDSFNPRKMGQGTFLLDNFFETNNYIFVEGIFSGKYSKNIVYNKKTKKSFDVFFNYDLYDWGFHNDIDGGMPFWPKGKTLKGQLFCYMRPYRLKILMQNPYFKKINILNKQKNEYVKKLVDKSKISDNPIITIITEKK